VRSKTDRLALDAEIAGLPDLDLAAVRERWHQLFGNPAPKSLRQAFLVKACAYQIQVKAFGGLSAATKRHLREVAEAARSGAAVPSVPKIKPGTQLLRTWQGKTHSVTVLEKGFVWNGGRHASLSAIAKAITGTNWNGPTFFGLRRVPVANKNAAGSREERADA
jgi:Protein of unknown function (DUF2924)